MARETLQMLGENIPPLQVNEVVSLPHSPVPGGMVIFGGLNDPSFYSDVWKFYFGKEKSAGLTSRHKHLGATQQR